MKREYIKNVNKQLMITAVLTVVLIGVVILAYADYYDKVEAKLEENVQSYLKNIASAEVERLNLKFDGYLNDLGLLAAFLETNENAEEDDIFQIIQFYQESNQAAFLDVVYQNGVSIMDEPVIDDISEYDFFNEAFEGTGGIYGGVNSAAGENSVIFICPVTISGEVLMCIIAAYPEKEFENFSSGSIFADMTTTFITEVDGTLISKNASVGKQTNLYTILDNISPDDSSTFKQLKTQIQKGKSGILTYGSGDSLRYIIFERLNQGNLYMVTMLSASVIDPSGNEIEGYGLRLSAILAGSFLIYICYFILAFIFRSKKIQVYLGMLRKKKANKKLAEQLTKPELTKPKQKKSQQKKSE